MNEHFYSVIMAGGVGKRFWPRSRKNSPKQLLDIVGEKSMVNMTLERLKNLSPIDRILIITNYQQAKMILEQNDELTWDNFIIEPFGKNTAPAIALAALQLIRRDPKAVMGIFPADHLITQTELLTKYVNVAIDFATEQATLLTFGIVPTRPATGYGYIQIDKVVPDPSSIIHHVKTFAEKPNLATAQRFIKSGEFLWNSGMFVWQAREILRSLGDYLPDLHESFQMIKNILEAPDYETELEKIWQGIQAISVDYGILEQAQNVYVVKVDFDWSDVGSWDAVHNLEGKDKNQNVFRSEGALFQSSNNYIYSKNLEIFTRNIHNLIIIEENGVLLVIPREESEEVKEIVDTLPVINKENLL